MNTSDAGETAGSSSGLDGGSSTDETTTGESTGESVVLSAEDDALFTAQDEALTTDAAGGVLANDVSPEPDSLSVTAYDAVSTAGARLTVADDGSLSYTPVVGFWGPDSFGYTIEDASGQTATATAMVFVAPRQIALSDVAQGNGGFVINGEDPGDEAGFSVSGAGDVNGDGLDDLVLGAFRARPYGAEIGRSYVVFGKTDTDAVALSVEYEGGFVMNGVDSGDGAGFSVGGAGDFNGDGLDDVVIGAHRADPNGSQSGQSYLVYGKEDNKTVQLEFLGVNRGFSLNGETAGDVAGWSVSGAGDVNGDGLADIVVGAPNADPNGTNAGRSYVVFGTADAETIELGALGSGGFLISGEAADNMSGISVSGAGDVNGDGMDDVIVGASSPPPDGEHSSYVVFGKADAAAIELSALGAGGFTLENVPWAGTDGAPVSGAGDVNGDGLDDLIVGAPALHVVRPWGGGQSYVVFGKADPATVDLTALGANGFAINGAQKGDGSGIAVSGAGDVNGDGLDDVIVGTVNWLYQQAVPDRSYVVYGKADVATVLLNDLGDGGFVLDGVPSTASFGHAVSGAGDVNGDGVDDVIVGVPSGGPGRSYVVFGVRTQ